MKFREYASGIIICEDDFKEYDDSIPFYDDFYEVEISDNMIEYIVECYALP